MQQQQQQEPHILELPSKLQEHRARCLRYYYETVKPRNEMKTKKSPGRKPTMTPAERYEHLKQYMRDYHKTHFPKSNKPKGRPRKYQTEEEYLDAMCEATRKQQLKRWEEIAKNWQNIN